MKILLATSFFPPTHTAGTEKRTFGYARALQKRGHTIQVLCAGKWEEGMSYWNGTTDEVYQGIPVRRLHLNWQKSPDPNRYLYDNPVISSYFTHSLQEWQPDVVHVTSCLTLSASIIPAAKKLGLPVVLTLTDFWFACPKLSLLKFDDTLCNGITTSKECIECLCWQSSAYQKLRRFSGGGVATVLFDAASKLPFINRQRGLRGMALDIQKRKEILSGILKLADAVTAPSSHLSQTFKVSGVDRPIRVIQSGHDLSWLEGVEKTRADRLRIGYIGQFIPTKGVHVLLEAFGSTDWNGKAELHLYGSPETNPNYWQELQKVKNHNPGMTYFHGPFAHEQLGTILAGIDVLVVPSIWHENNPRVIQEAFASKTPVIASDVGGIAEYIQHGVNGYLFARGISSELNALIQQITMNPMSLSQLSNGIPKVKTIYQEVDELEMIYQQICLHAEVQPL